jgi:hypothetical protein
MVDSIVDTHTHEYKLVSTRETLHTSLKRAVRYE